MALIVRQSNYRDERMCPVCKKIVKPSCKGHPDIPYAIYRMIEVKLAIKKRKRTLEAKIDERRIVHRRENDKWLMERNVSDERIMPF